MLFVPRTVAWNVVCTGIPCRDCEYSPGIGALLLKLGRSECTVASLSVVYVKQYLDSSVMKRTIYDPKSLAHDGDMGHSI
jgi:hypothetical protein